MLAKQTKQIDDITFEVTQLAFTGGMNFLAKLGRLSAPALGKLGKALEDGNTDQIDMGEALAGVAAVIVSLPEDPVSDLFQPLLKDSCTVTVNGKMQAFWPVRDLLLAGKYGTAVKLFAFALEVNYGNFFDALRDAAGPFLASKKPEASAA